MIEIKIPDEYVQLCKDWYCGSSSMMYAVASTGGLTRGTIRPYTTDGRPYTDEEWQWSLWSELVCEIRDTHNDGINSQTDEKALEQFERYAESVKDQLVAEYGIDI